MSLLALHGQDTQTDKAPNQDGDLAFRPMIQGSRPTGQVSLFSRVGLSRHPVSASTRPHSKRSDISNKVRLRVTVQYSPFRIIQLGHVRILPAVDLLRNRHPLEQV